MLDSCLEAQYSAGRGGWSLWVWAAWPTEWAQRQLRLHSETPLKKKSDDNFLMGLNILNLNTTKHKAENIWTNKGQCDSKGQQGDRPSSSSHSRSKEVLSSFPLVDLVLVIKSQLLSVFGVSTVASDESPGTHTKWTKCHRALPTKAVCCLLFSWVMIVSLNLNVSPNFHKYSS